MKGLKPRNNRVLRYEPLESRQLLAFGSSSLDSSVAAIVQPEDATDSNSFEVGRQSFHLSRPASGDSDDYRVELRNESNFMARFEMRFNGNITSNMADLVEQIRADSSFDPAMPDYARAYHYLRRFHTHDFPLTGRFWQHDPNVYINSLGFGLSDDAASVLTLLWREMGYDARVWLLAGHVVPEVHTGERWEMYDADLGVYYHNQQRQVAGVEELANDSLLILQPIDPVSDNPRHYSGRVADIYATTEDNGLCTVCFQHQVNRDLVFQIPTGGAMTWGQNFSDRALPTVHIDSASQFRQLKVTVPAGYTGSLDIPLVLFDIQGNAADVVRLGEQTFSLGGDEVFDYFARDPAEGNRTQPVHFDDNSQPIEVIYLLNRHIAEVLPDNVVDIAQLTEQPADLTASIRGAGRQSFHLSRPASGDSDDYRVELRNESNFMARFEMRFNGNITSNMADLVEQIRADSSFDPAMPDYARAYHYLRRFHTHDFPLTGRFWQHDPNVYINSLGFGLCDDAASVLTLLWREMGYDARVWLLAGHVVPEVHTGERWEMYDADLGVYYHNQQRQVAGVEELANDSLLILQPIDPVSDNPRHYSGRVADIYATTEDNGLCTVCFQHQVNRDLVFQIPTGGAMTWGQNFSDRALPTVHIDSASQFRQLKVTVPAGYTGSLDIPLVLFDIQGNAADVVRLGEQTFSLGGDEVFDYFARDPAEGNRTQPVHFDDNSQPIEVIYLLNRHIAEVLPDNVIDIAQLTEQPADLTASIRGAVPGEGDSAQEGDADGDGDVDSADHTMLVSNWTGALLPGEGDRTRAQGDADGDGDVDSADRTIVVQNWTGALSQAQQALTQIAAAVAASQRSTVAGSADDGELEER